MKLILLKVHKLDKPASHNNLTKLTGIPIITAYSWITSNPWRLQGTELDRIILKVKNLFKELNIPFPGVSKQAGNRQSFAGYLAVFNVASYSRSGHNNQLVTNNLDCHSRLLFQSRPQYTSKHFETPAYPLIYNSYDLLLLLDKLHATRATVSEVFFF